MTLKRLNGMIMYLTVSFFSVGKFGVKTYLFYSRKEKSQVRRILQVYCSRKERAEKEEYCKNFNQERKDMNKEIIAEY
jgi:hypothetical protein